MENDLERTLEVFCDGAFDKDYLKNYFKKIGKTFYFTQLEKYKKKKNPTDFALVDLVDYLFDTREKMFGKTTSKSFNNSLRDFYENSN